MILIRSRGFWIGARENPTVANFATVGFRTLDEPEVQVAGAGFEPTTSRL